MQMTVRKTKGLLWWLLALTAGLFLLFGVEVSTAKAMESNPKPTRQYVVDDYADVLSPGNKRSVISKEKQYQNTYARPQVVMMTIPDTENHNESIDDYSDDLLSHPRWHFGNKKFNNGVLILLEDNGYDGSQNHVRISTGYGVEGLLPDATCHDILEDNASLLKSSDKRKVDQGMQNVFNRVTHILDTKYAHLTKSQLEAIKRRHQRKKRIEHILTAIVVIAVLLLLLWPFHHHSDYWNSKDHDFLWDCVLWHMLWGADDSTPGVFNGALHGDGDDGDSGGSFGGFSDAGGGGSFGGGGSSI